MKHIEMRKTLIFLLVGACVSLSTALGQAEPVLEQDKLIVIGTNRVELGAITCEQTKTYPFRLRNVSAKPVKIIALMPTCHCITGTCDKKELAPNEETVVNVTLDPAEINGHFQRGLWVKWGLQKKDLVLLSLSGEAVPLFTGGPEFPLVILADRAGVTITNRYTLTAAKANLFLGTPVLSTDENMGLTVALATNAFETVASYDLTLVLKPHSNGFHSAAIKLPVSNQSNTTSTIRYVIQARVGAKLMATPSSLLLPSDDKPLQMRVRLTAETADFDAKRLTWSPQIEGITVAVLTNAVATPSMLKSKNKSPLLTARKKSSLFVTLTLSPAAVAEMMTRKDPELSFQYPSLEPAAIRLVTQ